MEKAINILWFTDANISYHTITPFIDLETFHYNNLQAGDEVVLFRIAVVDENLCPIDVRLWENGVDPSPSMLPDGSDYSNGFTVGGTNQIYESNILSEDYEDDISNTLDNAVTCVGEFAILTPSLSCAPDEIAYEWSTGETTPSISVYNDGVETYSVTITGTNGYFSILTAEVYNVQSILSSENDNTICIGESNDLFLDNGSWLSSDPAVVSIDSEGNATGISAGTSVLTYIDNDTGCAGEATFTVLNSVPVDIGADEAICIGETLNLSSGGITGTWVSSTPEVATTTPQGLVTAINAGQATFIFTPDSSTFCESNITSPLIVLPSAIVILEENTICINSSTFATSSSFGGTWTSDNSAIATINAFTGEITGIGAGQVGINYTDGDTGCSSETTTLTVVLNAEVEIIGSDKICVGGTTQLSPSSGGLWNSANVAVATVDNYGLVTGINFGVTTFTFQDTVGNCENGITLPVTVGNQQGIANVGTDEICIGSTTQLSPNIGGNWTSNNPSIAAPDGMGLVTGFSNGIAQFIFTTTLPDCEVIEEDIEILVNELPLIALTGSSEICIGQTTTIISTGTIQYVDYQGSTYDDSGLITGVESGITEYFAINAEGCSSDTIEIKVNSGADIAFTGPDKLCIGDVTQITPSVGGTWTSSDNDVATINNSGLVTAVGSGTTSLEFTDTTTGCISENGLILTVYDVPNVSIAESVICGGSHTQVFSSTGGTWSSSNPNIASIDNNGLITPIFFGQVSFTFTSTSNGCPSEPVDLLIIANPTITSNETAICEGETINVQILGGSEINHEGPGDIVVDEFEDGTFNVTFSQAGNHILFTTDDKSTGCPIVSLEITVFNTPVIEPASNPTIFVGDTIEIFSPDEIGELLSGDFEIAFPTSSTSIVGIGEGVVEIVGISEDGCFSNTILITVLSPDPCNGLDTTINPVILGTAFIDNNENDVYDGGDAPLRNVIISASPGNFSILTDDNGMYHINLPTGDYTLTAKVNEGTWVENEISIDNITISDPCNDGYNFGFVPMSVPEPMVSLTMHNSIARCDFETRFYITVENTGTDPLEATLQFTFDDKTSFFASDISNTLVNGSVATAEIGPLDPFSPEKYRITVKMPSGTSNLPMLDFESKLIDASGTTIAEYGYSDQLRCSYDPNDKREYPDREGEENLTLMDEDLEYTIRFQNNGNDTAFQVKIVDALDPVIDPSTIRVMSASHAVETCIDGSDLIFLFEDILLVDSTTNYAESQGYVTFRCNTKEGQSEMTPVHNQADIIFDTNSPIVTNQTINTLVSVLCTDKQTTIEASICEGDSYEGYEVSGTYSNTFDLPFGCDSVVTIVLDVQGITYTQQNLKVCTGSSITIAGNVYDIEENTTIVDTTVNDNGCITNILTFEVEAVNDILGNISE